jgi:hypothetical protein
MDVAETIDVVFRALLMEALTGSASLTKMKEADMHRPWTFVSRLGSASTTFLTYVQGVFVARRAARPAIPCLTSSSASPAIASQRQMNVSIQ